MSLKSTLQGYFQRFVCVAGDSPYRGICSALYELLELPPTGAFPVPCMSCWNCPIQGRFQCLVCIAKNAPYGGIFRAIHELLEMPHTGAF